MADSKKKKHNRKEDKNERRSMRMSYILPVALAVLFMILDLYGIYKGTNAHAMQYNIEGKNIDYVNCCLDLFISYIPSSVAALIIFAFMQQQVYGVYAGLNKDKVSAAYILIFIFLASYVVFLLVGCSKGEKWGIAGITLFLCFYIWLRLLDQNIKKIEKNKAKHPNAITGNC